MTTDYRRFAVLCVDDDRASLVALSYALETDFWIITARDGDEALRKLAAADVAVIVADQRMPGMKGSKVCARARAIRPNVARMILTAYSDIQEVLAAINEGQVSRYLAKPWREEELKATLRTAIEVFHMQRLVAEMEIKLMRNERLAGARAATDMIDHDIRQRLGALQIGLESVAAISHRVPDPHGGQLQEIAADGKAAIDYVTSLMKRVRAGAVVRADEPADADAARIVEMAITLSRHELVRRCARCELVADSRPRIAIPASELAQVTLNLLTNACESLPQSDAGPQDREEPSDGETCEHLISIHLRTEEENAVLTVKDPGRGIPPEDLGRIFQQGFTTKHEREGTGLGLAIVKELVDGRGGKIEIESTPGVGTTFSVTLPLVLDEPEDEEPA